MRLYDVCNLRLVQGPLRRLDLKGVLLEHTGSHLSRYNP